MLFKKIIRILKRIIFLIFKPKSSFWKYGINNSVWFFNFFQNPKNTYIWNHNFIYYWNYFLPWDYKIIVWNWCRFAMNILVIAYSHDFNAKDLKSIPYDERYMWWDIEFKDWVWVWAKVTVLAWVTIWKWVVIWAWSVVTKSIPDYEVWWWNPARKISERKNIKIFETLLKENIFKPHTK